MKTPITIKTKLTLWFILVTLLLTASFSSFAYFLLSKGLSGKTVHPWNMRIAQVEKTNDGNYEITEFPSIGLSITGSQPNGPVKSVSYSGEELIQLASQQDVIKVGNISIDKSALESLGLTTNDQVWFYFYLTENNEVAATVTWSANDVEGTLLTFRQILFILTPIVLVIAGIFGYFYVKIALGPVQNMTHTAMKIEEKNLTQRLEVTSSDELGQLASTLNRMLTRLEDAFKREKQFTADASHELRMPLAIVQGEATLALEKDRSKEEYRKSLEAISQETEHMSAILKKLLFLARNENVKVFEFERVNLKELLTELADDIELLCEDKSLHFKFDAQEDLVVKGDAVSLQELFYNLLNNAIQYTQQEGNISLRLSREGNNACIRVQDTGIGIPEEHLEYIFDRFYRVDKSSSRNKGGAGLGLSICKRIIEIHGGEVSVESKVGVGSIFRVLIPISEKI